MLYVFHGSDILKVSDRAKKLVAGLRAKRPDASVYSFEGAVTELASLDELVGASGLFVRKHIVVLRSVFEDKETGDLMAKRVQQFAQSENIFVIVENAIPAAHVRLLKEHASKVEEHKREKRARGFDEYGLVSALKRKDKRALWTALLTAQRAGENGESLCGLLHWAVRDMHAHAARYASLYTRDELVGLSRSLITLYHDAHRGLYDIDTALEDWVLAL